MSRAAVKNEPLRAPKQETATMTEKMIPPIAPKIARPKSRATVFERSTVDSRRTLQASNTVKWRWYSPCLEQGNRIHLQVGIETWSDNQRLYHSSGRLERTVVITMLEWMIRGRFLPAFFISPTIKLAEGSVGSLKLRSDDRYHTLVPTVICPEPREQGKGIRRRIR